MIDPAGTPSAVLRELSRSVRSLMGVRRGRLVRLVVSVPQELATPSFATEAQAHFRSEGLDGFELEAVPGDGPLRVIVAEFER